MFVVRPKSILGTPRALARALQAKLRFYPNPRKRRIYDYKKDFLFSFISSDHIRNAPPEYFTAGEFFRSSKFAQRMSMEAAGIPIPRCAGTLDGVRGLQHGPFVVRPLMHQKGQHYRVTENSLDFQPGREYISEVFPKLREYRIIYIKGHPAIVLRKKLPDGSNLGPNDAWNAARGSRFQTVNDVQSSRLSRTDAFAKLQNFHVVKGSHICCADVLYRKGKYVICEFNSCPALSIESNIEKVKQYIEANRQM